jgi:hypothetical protein
LQGSRYRRRTPGICAGRFFVIYKEKIMDTKKWYQSKLVWTGVLTTVLGILPLVATYVKLIAPTTALIVDGTVVLISGIATVVIRVWFTDTAIS